MATVTWTDRAVGGGVPRICPAPAYPRRRSPRSPRLRSPTEAGGRYSEADPGSDADTDAPALPEPGSFPKAGEVSVVGSGINNHNWTHRRCIVIDPSYIEEVLIPEDKLQARIAELGAAVSRDYAGQDLLLLAVLKGSVLFLADLMRHITVPHAIDFMATSSYGTAFESSGVVRILKIDQSIEDRDVLIVEDIIDTGRTLDYLVRILRARPASFPGDLHAPEQACQAGGDVPVKYIGFNIPDKFVLGYGLDFHEKYRNLPYVAVLEPKH